MRKLSGIVLLGLVYCSHTSCFSTFSQLQQIANGVPMTITEDGQMIQVDTGEAGEEAAGEVLLTSFLLKYLNFSL